MATHLKNYSFGGSTTIKPKKQYKQKSKNLAPQLLSSDAFNKTILQAHPLLALERIDSLQLPDYERKGLLKKGGVVP